VTIYPATVQIAYKLFTAAGSIAVF